MAPFLFFLLLLLLLIQSYHSMASDNITATTPLSGNQQLVSKGGNFAVGFYSLPPQGNSTSSTPINNNSTTFYIAIWYHNIPQVTTVWIANGKNPVSNPTTSSLSISSDGNLVIIDKSTNQEKIVWSTNVTFASNASTVAQILDTGNLVLRDVSNTSLIYWQSLDHPTNTWLPTGKLGFNKITGVSQRLFSWKNSANPAPGMFSLELDPNGTSQYFLQWDETVDYWTSGVWNGQIFSLVPEMTANFAYNFQFVNTSTENYFIYSMKQDSVISRFIMDNNGQIKQLTWVPEGQTWTMFWAQPKTQCLVYKICGPYGSCNENALPFCRCLKGFNEKNATDWNLDDYSGGCVRSKPLQCQVNAGVAKTMKPDKFYTMEGVRLPDNSLSSVAGSVQDCESACLGNCSCNAYAFNGSGCFMWFGQLVNLQEQYVGNGQGTVFLRLAASELPDAKSNTGVIIGGVVGGVAVVVICLVVLIVLFRRYQKERILRIPKAVGGTLAAFRYSDLQYVTKNFSEKLGGGGFGSVFKGMLPDSTAIAVKRLDGFHQGEKQFRAEVSTIGTIQHVNLVRLLGFCSEATRRLLVYEFMPKGSLDLRLFHDGTTVLSWSIRYQIALGTARGLAYLHEKCRDCIIHCDIKPENILLDDSFVPKVADFGLAKLLGRDFSRVLTTMRGTRGYLAPEWITGVPITPKADVFSYGMMLFEIISGRRNSEHGEGKSLFFPTVAATKLLEGDVQSLVDERLDGEANLLELERACKVACWCIQDEETSRPTMGEVGQILEGFLNVNMPPIPRSLRVLGESPEYINFFSDVSSKRTSQTRSSTSTTSQAQSAVSTI